MGKNVYTNTARYIVTIAEVNSRFDENSFDGELHEVMKKINKAIELEVNKRWTK